LPKDKEKPHSDASMASFNHLVNDNLNQLQKNADENFDYKITDQKTEKVAYLEKKEKRASKLEYRHESPYSKKDYPPIKNSNERKLNKKAH
jgi:hypothetical protein